ncbi:MAG: response regulator [Bacteroidales bacterium]
MNTNIIWVDDEIDLLKAHILFLQSKGYTLHTASNGQDALEMIKNTNFDLLFLDENMPGINGLETIKYIKELRPNLPVVMITKNEEEDIMHRAIGAQIADYLIKPVHPNQILLSIKKVLHHREIISAQSTSDYRESFRQISEQLTQAKSINDFCDLYRKLIMWEIDLQQSNDQAVREILSYQMSDANKEFCKFISQNYLKWFDKNSQETPPLMSHTILREKVFPHIANTPKTLFLLIDNLRYDQWRSIAPEIQQHFKIDSEELYCSILPTTTQYARNAIFAGLMPSEIERLTPDYWLNDEEEGGKNQYEEEFLTRQMQRLGINKELYFYKIINPTDSKQVCQDLSKLNSDTFACLVYNFVDMISHTRTSHDIMRVLTENNSAYRSLTKSWFQYSDLLDILKELSQLGYNVILSTDHGTTRIHEDIKIQGDKNTSPNLRYKTGRILSYNPKDVFEIKNPKDAFLPSTNLSSSYVFARNADFFVYPNNYHEHVKYFRNTFQHGGISLEEMLIPIIKLSPL